MKCHESYEFICLWFIWVHIHMNSYNPWIHMIFHMWIHMLQEFICYINSYINRVYQSSGCRPGTWRSTDITRMFVDRPRAAGQARELCAETLLVEYTRLSQPIHTDRLVTIVWAMEITSALALATNDCTVHRGATWMQNCRSLVGRARIDRKYARASALLFLGIKNKKAYLRQVRAN